MNTKLKLAAAILAATLTSAANAGIVTEWGYNNQAGFIDYSGTTGIGFGVADDVAASGDSSGGGTSILTGGPYPTTLTWGKELNDLDAQSNLHIDSPVTGSITTNDWSFVDGTDITHNNFIITGDSLTNASVLDGLILTPTAWSIDPDAVVDPDINAPYFAPELAFGIDFFETPNNANPCANSEQNGQGDNINGCGDVFEITGLGGLGIVPIIGPDFIEFTVPFFLTTGDEAWDNVSYFITTRLSGLTVLPAAYECQSGPACFGFVTQESKSNVLLAQFKISTVPEPAAIALFGLGLIATGFAGRRKRKL
jgi:hypothetical protein